MGKSRNLVKKSVLVTNSKHVVVVGSIREREQESASSESFLTIGLEVYTPPKTNNQPTEPSNPKTLEPLNT